MGEFDWIDEINQKEQDNQEFLNLEGLLAFQGNRGASDEAPGLKLTPRQIKLAAKNRAARIGKEENLRDTLNKLDPPGPPRPGEAVHMVASYFDFWTCCPILLETIGRTETLYCATWAIARQQARECVELMERGKIGRAYFVAGIYMKRREPVVYSYLYENLVRHGGGVKCFETHVKVMLLANEERGDYFAIETSANLTGNPRLEHFTIFNDRELYEWHRSWIMEAYNWKTERYAPW